MKNSQHNSISSRTRSFFGLLFGAGSNHTQQMVLRLSDMPYAAHGAPGISSIGDQVRASGGSSALAPHRKGISVRGRVMHTIFYHTAKIAAFMLLLTAVASGTSLVGNTVSYYADIERSVGNLLIADPLSFTLTPGSLNIDISTSSVSFAAKLIPDATSEPIKYTIGTVTTGGNETLCSLMNVSVPSYGYSGPLALFTGVATTSLLEIPMTFTFPENLSAGENTSCFMDMVFTGRNADAEEGRGYTDKHALALQFYIPDTTKQTPAIVSTRSATTIDDIATSTGTPVTASSSENISDEVSAEIVAAATTTDATSTAPVPPAALPIEPPSGGAYTPPQASPEPAPVIETSTTTPQSEVTVPPPPPAPQSPPDIGSTTSQNDTAEKGATVPAENTSATPPAADPLPAA